MNAAQQTVSVIDFAEWALVHRGGKKFTVEEVEGRQRLYNLAVKYADDYIGDFSFMLDMKACLNDRGFLTDGQVKGTLNCLLAELRRGEYNGERIDIDEVPMFPNHAGELVHKVENGLYTIVFEDETYVTIKISDIGFGNFPAGTQKAGYLYGEDNESSYTNFATVRGEEFQTWSRFSENGRPSKALAVLLEAKDAGDYGLAYALRSNRCYRCGRTLTVPASIHRGLGPICAGVMNG